ncbi:palindromic element RPE1 domain-containing protein [Candidatus Tisiphia endosymbiont of Beris chalybata]|uniref:palindromic element RPE1 domain-containing protein n=1 Tax=Candidatus Tisiphia endosymbiont of Beris chalybata TaxID=3066262 RepID=UPI00312CBDE5
MHNLKIIEEFLGETKSSTAAYIDVREDSSLDSTYKLPTEVEFRKRSTSSTCAGRLIYNHKWKIENQPSDYL